MQTFKQCRYKTNLNLTHFSVKSSSSLFIYKELFLPNEVYFPERDEHSFFFPRVK